MSRYLFAMLLICHVTYLLFYLYTTLLICHTTDKSFTNVPWILYDILRHVLICCDTDMPRCLFAMPLICYVIHMPCYRFAMSHKYHPTNMTFYLWAMFWIWHVIGIPCYCYATTTIWHVTHMPCFYVMLPRWPKRYDMLSSLLSTVFRYSTNASLLYHCIRNIFY